MGSPYAIAGPALISFSGGRTSAYMLKMMLDAAGGSFARDIHVVFANTGKEREETLRFVHECQVRWAVPIHWVEFRSRKTSLPIEERFEEVGYNSASRDGQPFAELIRDKGFTPNATMRWCTQELKIRVMKWFMQARGYSNWTNVIGLRHDERHRVIRSQKPNREPWSNIMPLDEAKVSNRDVRAFWAKQDFDLQLLPFEGNCDGCFLKARPKLWEVERTKPGTLQWWADQEAMLDAMCSARFGPFRKPVFRVDDGEDGEEIRVFDHWEITWPKAGNQFVTEYSYAELIQDVQRQPDMFAGGLFDNDPEMDAECGLWCGEAA